MPRNNNRGGRSGSKNNNPTGRNQYSSDWGVMELARERPVAAAAATVGAAAAGLFLWSKRAQISEQLSSLSEQMSDWRSGQGEMFQSSSDDTAGLTSSGQTGTASARGRSSANASGRSRQPAAVG